MRYSPKNHKWAVIQSGYAVFGTGRTYEAALADAAKNMEIPERDESGNETGFNISKPTIRDVENELVERHQVVDGDCFITDNAEEIKSYVENQ
jgi:hypothetical protein